MDNTNRTISFVRKTQWEDLPRQVRHQSKRCLLDTLGALLAGTKTPVAKLMTEFAQEQFSGNGGAILATGKRASLVGAALANGFAGNALDIDDGYRMIKGHPGACVLPVALGAGETLECAGRTFLAALVVGYEVGIRAGLIRHAIHHTYHSSGSWGAIAGAAVAGKIFGLDAKMLRNAIGAAEYHAPIAPMLKGLVTPSMGKDSIGWGCMVAMSSVLMSQRGFTGIRPLFEDTPEPSWINSLGETYEILNLYFKPYSACRWAHPAIEGALKICRNNHLPVRQLRRIEVRTFPEAAALRRNYPQTTEEGQYSIAFPLAAALLDGEVGPRQVLPPRLFDSEVRSVMDKVEFVTEKLCQVAFPAKTLADVFIETTNGETFSSGTMSARWDPASKLPTDDELAAKFQWLAQPVLGITKAKEVESMVWDFENSGSVHRLIGSCNKRK